MKKWLFLPTMLGVTCLPLIGLVGCGGAAPKAVDFQTDSWETIIYYANKGVDALHKAYSQDCENNPLVYGTLIGYQRKIELNGVEHSVRVIDEGVDVYQKSNEDVAAALTFQFDNIISDSEGASLVCHWVENDPKDNHDYWTSNLEHALNGAEDDVKWWSMNEDQSITESEEKQSVYSMIKEGSPLLAENIKNVKRKVIIGYDNARTITEKPTKLFEPVLANLFSEIGIDGSALFDDNQKELAKSEGLQYSYFKIEETQKNKYDHTYINDVPVDQETTFECLSKDDCVGSTGDLKVSYWLTTPDLDLDDSAWHVYCNDKGVITYDGSLTSGDVSLSDDGVAPCFCI